MMADDQQFDSESPLGVPPSLVNGYDGFSGTHDNLFWDGANKLIYTLNNKLIVENIKSREQTVKCDASVKLSCIALNLNNKMLAVGEGESNSQGNSHVFVYSLGKDYECELLQKLTFH